MAELPFEVNHESVGKLILSRDLPAHELAVNLRRAFSAIVTGNVKEECIRAVERDGPFRIHGDAAVLAAMDDLLRAFVAQNRMKLLVHCQSYELPAGPQAQKYEIVVPPMAPFPE